MADLSALMAEVITKENPCLEAGGDYQYVVKDNLPIRSEMVIATIVDVMAILNMNAFKDKMIHHKVEAEKDHNFHIFINEVVKMAVLVDRTEVVICSPYNNYWIV